MAPDGPFDQGRRAAAKDAVAFLHDRARGMTDTHAARVLDAAALALGEHFAQEKRGESRVSE